MRRGRLSLAISAICALALALGLGFGAGGAASAAPASGASAAAATSLYTERTVVINCLGRPEIRPGSFTLTCADGYEYLTGLSWTSWTPKLASGYGTQVQNDCIPSCVGGHFHGYPVLVVLWGTAAVHGSPGTLRYTTMTLIYTGARPKIFNGHRWVQGPVTITASLFA
jgi:hypothetical protein